MPATPLSATPPRSSFIDVRSLLFGFLIALSVIIFRQFIETVLGLAWRTDEFTHILLILPISLWLVYMERANLPRNPAYAPSPGIILGIIAIAIAAFGRMETGREDLSLPIAIFSLVLFWMACIIGCYGPAVFKSLLFPFLFLFLLVPLPISLLDKAVYALQVASTQAVFELFKLAGIPVLRSGFLLTFPSLQIEVAKECSGIRSSIMLFITGLILAHLFLRSWWSQLVFVLLIVPFSIAKNAIRIFTLSTLGMYVDPGFLTGRLHHQGGIVFFLIALAGLVTLLWILQRIESRTMPKPRRLVS